MGCIAGAMVIPPILDLLYHAYGFTGALPRAGMDPAQGAGRAAGDADVGDRGRHLHPQDRLDDDPDRHCDRRRRDPDRRRAGAARRHCAAAACWRSGIGIYLPPSISVTIVIGAFVGWLIDRALRRRAAAGGVRCRAALCERPRRRGVLLASGLIVGESLVGVLMAGIIGASGNQAPLALVGEGFEPTAAWLGLAAFVLVCAAFFGRVLTTRGDDAQRTPL